MNNQVIAEPTELNRSDYLAALLASCGSAESSKIGWLAELRSRSIALIQEQAIPTMRDEEWRFTDLSALLQYSFQPASAGVVADSLVAEVKLPEAMNSRLTFVNGKYAPSLSNVTGLPANIFVGSLTQLSPAASDNLQQYCGQQPGYQEVFTALNTTALADVAVVWVQKNQILTQPIHLLFITVAGEVATISQPRCLVVAESGSRITLVQEYIAAPGKVAAPYFCNSVTEVWLAENAEINHTRIQQESTNSFHVGKTAISQAARSRYTINTISLGAQLSRHNLEVFQTGEATETTLNGLTKIGGTQISDTHSAIALNHPHGTTRQLHKCVVDDHARAIFNGKVLVPKAAQMTDAGQLNRNLLLSSKARIDTKPQLEITADNVKCSHGATVSQLEADEIFYLQSRGLDIINARDLLINAFATEIIVKIPVASVREKLSVAVINPF